MRKEFETFAVDGRPSKAGIPAWPHGFAQGSKCGTRQTANSVLGMREPPENSAARVNRDWQIHARQAQLLWKSPLPQLANLINAALVCGVLWDFVPHREFTVWFGLTAVIAIARLYLWHRYKQLRPPPERAQYWALLFAVSSGLAASLWGVSAWLIPDLDIVVHLFLAFVIAGMGAGAVAANSVYLPALYAYLVPSYLPLAMAFLALGEFIYVAMSAMTVLFVIVLVMIGRHLNGSLIDTFDLQINNAKLVEDLTSARDMLESKVAERTAELSKEIAERRLVEQALRSALQSTEIANRGKSEFLANMNHELRTPLNSVIAFAEIIKDQRFGPVGNAKYLEYSNHIYDSGNLLLETIGDIMDLARIESGKEFLNEEIFDVAKIARSVLGLVETRAQDAGVTLELELAGELPSLRADARKVKQVLVHLLSNAIKFTMPSGRAKLSVRCDKDAGHTIKVTDTGIGIAAEDLQMILTPFAQADGKLDRKHEGAGLGLPLTKSLVEMHGGRLDLQSEEGVGTTVLIRFPADRVGSRKRDTPPASLQERI